MWCLGMVGYSRVGGIGVAWVVRKGIGWVGLSRDGWVGSGWVGESSVDGVGWKGCDITKRDASSWPVNLSIFSNVKKLNVSIFEYGNTLHTKLISQKFIRNYRISTLSNLKKNSFDLCQICDQRCKKYHEVRNSI